MARPRKSALKQRAVEPEIEIKEEVVEVPAKLLAPELESVIPMEKPEEVEAPVEEVELPTIEEIEEELEVAPEPVFANEPIEIDLMEEKEETEVEVEEVDPTYEEKLARFLNNKTSSPYRLYLRTGIIPKL